RAPPARRSGRLDADFVPDRAYALHFLRRLRRTGRLLLRIGEAGELDHAAVSLDVERARGARPDIGRDRSLAVGAERGVGARFRGIALRRRGARCEEGEQRGEEQPARYWLFSHSLTWRSASSFWMP